MEIDIELAPGDQSAIPKTKEQAERDAGNQLHMLTNRHDKFLDSLREVKVRLVLLEAASTKEKDSTGFINLLNLILAIKSRADFRLEHQLNTTNYPLGYQPPSRIVNQQIRNHCPALSSAVLLFSCSSLDGGTSECPGPALSHLHTSG